MCKILTSKVSLILLSMGLILLWAGCSNHDMALDVDTPIIFNKSSNGFDEQAKYTSKNLKSTPKFGMSLKKNGIIVKTVTPTVSANQIKASFTGLDANTTYTALVTAEFDDNKNVHHTVEKSIDVTTLGVSTVAFATPTNPTKTTTSATINSEILNLGGLTISESGIVVDVATGPTIVSTIKWSSGPKALGTLSNNFTGLLSNKTYYARAYAIDAATSNAIYSSELIFTTNAITTVAPTVLTIDSSNVTQTTATAGGNVTSDGGAAVTARGVCWNTTGSPTIANSKTTDGTGTGTFSSSLTGLTAGTTYFFRAYATNSVNTTYGTELKLKTYTVVVTPTAPTVTTSNTITNATSTSCIGSGDVTSDGGATILERGICWNTSGSATTADSKATAAGTTGTFTATISPLIAGTSYFFRAYARNSVGTTYGSTDIKYTPAATVTIPTITTTSAIPHANNCGEGAIAGNITNDGGAAITVSGICWGTSANPDITGNKTTDGPTATGTFTSYSTGTPNTVYHARAYATNSAGTAYGADLTFTSFIGVGCSYGGGKVFYMYTSGDNGYSATVNHGLITPSTDLSDAVWGASTPVSASNSDLTNYGAANTTDLAGASPSSPAAVACENWTYGGQTDWFLPSDEEQMRLFLWANALGAPFDNLLVNTTTHGERYWSSTEDRYFGSAPWTNAVSRDLEGWNANTSTKSLSLHVRAIRKF